MKGSDNAPADTFSRLIHKRDQSPTSAMVNVVTVPSCTDEQLQLIHDAHTKDCVHWGVDRFLVIVQQSDSVRTTKDAWPRMRYDVTT